MLKRTRVVALAGLICSCRSTYSPGMAATYDDRRARLEDWLFANTVNPQCDGQDSAPATMNVKPLGVYSRAHEQPCGLVVNEVRSPAYKAEFFEKVCGRMDDASCADKYERTFIARLAERYVAADLNAVSTRCTAHPIDCANMAALELWVLESHNNARRAQYDQMLSEATSIYQQDQSTYAANARAANAAAWQAVADSFKPPPQINCTSTTYGTTTNTRCQ